MTQPQLIPTPEPLHLAYIPGQSNRLVLSFAGVGLESEATPRGEFPKLASCDGENHVLLIADSTRSWMNAPGLVEALDDAVQRLCDRIAPQHIAAIGNSMGGTAALIYADRAPVDSVFSMVPQYSVSRAVLRKGSRWRHYTDAIREFRFPAAPNLAGRGKDVVILHGGNQHELLHAEQFVQSDDIRHFIFPKLNHQLAAHLKNAGQLQGLVSTFLRGQYSETLAMLRQIGGMPIAEFQAHRAQKQFRQARRQARTQTLLTAGFAT